MVDQGLMRTNPVYRQMVEKRQVQLIGQIEEVGDERGVELQTVRSWEKRCGDCNLIHRGGCY